MSKPYPIYPSILAFDFARLREQVATVDGAGAAALHFDVMDGHFVPNLTFGALVIAALRPQTALPCYAHLMVYEPEKFIAPMVKAGANRLYLHPEATPNIHRALLQVREAGVEAGVAINPGSPLCLLEPLLGLVESVLVMSVNPGFGGQAFIPASVGRVAELRAMIQRLDVPVEIDVDGGVDADTIGKLVSAGMTGAVVGSALFAQGDPAAMVRRLQELAAG